MLQTGFKFTLSHAIRLFAMPLFLAGVLIVSGASPAHAGANPDGSFSHQVPIEIPPGTGGMQPALSLVYNSNAPNGMLGVGWSLAGIPAITRISNGEGIHYNGTDTYAGPGGRLVDISGNQTLYHTERESFADYTPIYSGCPATIEPTEPCQWMVLDNNGNKLYFGGDSVNANDSFIEALNFPGHARVWALSKVEDIHGNYYIIEYNQDNGQFYPKSISYTFNDAGLSAYKIVEFGYDTSRSDFSPSFAQSTKVQTNWLLSEIRISTNCGTWVGCLNSDLVRKYQLQYDTGISTGRARLTSVQQFGKNGGALPAQTFTYAPGDNSFTANNLGTSSIGDLNFSGDFDGDGFSEIVYFNSSGWHMIKPGQGNYTHKFICGAGSGSYQQIGDFNGDGAADILQFANGTGWRVLEITPQGDGCPSHYWTYQNLVNLDVVRTGDFNGDGLTDMLHHRSGTWNVNGVSHDPGWYIYYSTGSAFIDPLSPVHQYGAGNTQLIGDLNGDGRSDLTYRTNKDGWRVFLSTQTGLPFDGIWSRAGTFSGENLIDLNGDGLADFTQYGPNGNDDAWRVYLSNGTYYVGNSPTWVRNLPDLIKHGDFNGDGLKDMIAYGAPLNFTGWKVYHGNGWGHSPAAWNGLPAINLYNSYLFKGPFIGDFNGDGLDDIVYEDDSAQLFAYYSQGAQPDKLIQIENALGGSTQIAYEPATTFQNADSSRPFDPNNSLYPIQANKSPRYLVKSITVSSGRDGDHDGSIDTYSTGYEYTNGLVQTGYREERKSLGFETVKVIDNQTGAYTVTTYNQGQTDMRLAGLPLETEQYALNSASQYVRLQRSTSQYEVIDLNNGGNNGTYLVRAKEDADHDLNGVDFASRTITYFPETGLQNEMYKKFVSYENLTDGQGAKIEHTWANIIQSCNQTVGMSRVVQEFVYEDDPNLHIYSRLIEKREIYQGEVTAKQLFGYDATGNMVSSSVLLNESWTPGATKVATPDSRLITTTFEYNPYGLITRRIDPAYDLNGNQSEIIYEYDPETSTQLITSRVINPSGTDLITTRTYDPVLGKIATVTDASGINKTTEYDEFGRLVSSKDHENNIVDWIAYGPCDAGNLSSCWTEKRTFMQAAEGASYSFQFQTNWPDGLGRIFKTASGFHHAYPGASQRTNITITEQIYSHAGQVIQEVKTMPDHNITQITSYAYDSFGRQTGTTYPDGTSSSASYDETSVTMTDPNGNSRQQTQIKTLDGYQLEITEPDLSTTLYQYDFRGRLVSATDADGQTSTVTYDNLNRKILLDEPTTGVWAYHYYDNGGLHIQSDPLNVEITYLYDAAGRLTKTDYPGIGEDVNYTYDIAPNFGLGRLAKVSDKSGVTSYDYDNRGNAARWVKEIYDVQDPLYNPNNPAAITPNIRLVFEATYDRANRLETLTYPDGEIVKNAYSEGGYLSQVRLLQPGQTLGTPMVTYEMGPNGSNTLLRTTGTDLFTGANSIYNNKVVTEIGFDTDTMQPSSLKTTLSAPVIPGGTNPVAQHYSYNYDDNGNISTIIDENVSAALIDDPNYKHRNQYFTYDNRNRLTRAVSHLYRGANADPANDTLNYSYSTGGNLKTKGDLTMYYGSDANCTYASKTHQVCKDSEGTNYLYNTNGNMTWRQGRLFRYDYEDRVKTVLSLGVEQESYVYDHSGSRVVKHNKIDNSATYTISGLYEITVHPDGRQYHTKYIYGMAGDLVAQFTKDNSQVNLIALANRTDQVLAGFVSLATVKNHWNTTQTRGDFYLFCLFTLLLLAAYLLTRPLRSGINQGAMPGISLAITILFLFQFVFNGCAAGDFTTDAPPWTIQAIPAGTPTLDVAVNRYDFTATNGRPTLGVFFFHPNHQGSTALVTDAEGKLVSEVHYTPYGEVIKHSLTNGVAKSQGPDNFRYKYTGQEEDIETGLMYYGARYYDPHIGRFTTADTIIDPNAGAFGLNRYMYVAGNPVNYTDPTGHSFLAALIIVALTTAAGAAGGYVAHGITTDDWSWEGSKDSIYAGMVVGFIAGLSVVAPYLLTGNNLILSQTLMQDAVINGFMSGFTGKVTTGYISPYNPYPNLGFDRSNCTGADASTCQPRPDSGGSQGEPLSIDNNYNGQYGSRLPDWYTWAYGFGIVLLFAGAATIAIGIVTEDAAVATTASETGIAAAAEPTYTAAQASRIRSINEIHHNWTTHKTLSGEILDANHVLKIREGTQGLIKHRQALLNSLKNPNLDAATRQGILEAIEKANYLINQSELLLGTMGL